MRRTITIMALCVNFSLVICQDSSFVSRVEFNKIESKLEILINEVESIASSNDKLLKESSTLSERYNELLSNFKSQDSIIHSLITANKEQDRQLISLRANGESIDSIKWQIAKTNLYAAIEAYKILNSDLSYIISLQSAKDYSFFLDQLSELNNETLGFDFTAILIKEAEKINFRNDNKLQKFLKVVHSISSSEIIKSIPYVSEALGITNSVVGVLNAASINDKMLDSARIDAFENALSGYLKYYEALEAANSRYSTTLEFSRNRVIELQILFYEYLKNEAQIIENEFPGFDEEELKISEENPTIYSAFFNKLFKEYNRQYVQRRIQDIENRFNGPTGNIMYSALIQSDEAKVIFEWNNNLQEFDKIANLAILFYEGNSRTEREYFDKISDAIALAAKEKLISETKLKSVQETHEQKFTTMTTTYETAVDIDELIGKLEKIQLIKIL